MPHSCKELEEARRELDAAKGLLVRVQNVYRWIGPDLVNTLAIAVRDFLAARPKPPAVESWPACQFVIGCTLPAFHDGICTPAPAVEGPHRHTAECGLPCMTLPEPPRETPHAFVIGGTGKWCYHDTEKLRADHTRILCGKPASAPCHAQTVRPAETPETVPDHECDEVCEATGMGMHIMGEAREKLGRDAPGFKVKILACKLHHRCIVIQGSEQHYTAYNVDSAPTEGAPATTVHPCGCMAKDGKQYPCKTHRAPDPVAAPAMVRPPMLHSHAIGMRCPACPAPSAQPSTESEEK